MKVDCFLLHQRLLEKKISEQAALRLIVPGLLKKPAELKQFYEKYEALSAKVDGLRASWASRIEGIREELTECRHALLEMEDAFFRGTQAIDPGEQTMILLILRFAFSGRGKASSSDPES